MNLRTIKERIGVYVIKTKNDGKGKVSTEKGIDMPLSLIFFIGFLILFIILLIIYVIKKDSFIADLLKTSLGTLIGSAPGLAKKNRKE